MTEALPYIGYILLAVWLLIYGAWPAAVWLWRHRGKS